MKLYNETIRCDVRIPPSANTIIETEARRTGIPKAVLLRSIVLKWIEQEYIAPHSESGRVVAMGAV